MTLAELWKRAIKPTALTSGTEFEHERLKPLHDKVLKLIVATEELRPAVVNEDSIALVFKMSTLEKLDKAMAELRTELLKATGGET